MREKLENFILDQSGRFFVAPDNPSTIDYQDKGEDYVLQALENTADITSTSKELESKIKDWPSNYHFSAKRANIFRALDFLNPDSKVLELGAGCGAITRFLGEKFTEVHAVEGNPYRANIARERCRDLENVKIFCTNIQDASFENQYDIVTLIGVLEYAPLFFQDLAQLSEASLSLLERTRRALKKSGTLILAIENRIGLKYWSGCKEDHTGKLFEGLHGYPQGHSAITYSKNEIHALLKAANFEFIEYYFPFPDYKLSDVILRDVPNFGRYYIHNWLKFPFEDPTGRAFFFHEGLCVQNLVQTGLFQEFANSFLILSSPANRSPYETPKWVIKKFANHSSWAKRFHHVISLQEDGREAKILRRSLSGEDHIANQTLEFALKDSGFVPGELFTFSAYRALFSSDFNKETATILNQLNGKLLSDFSTGCSDEEGYPLLKGEAIDCTLWNLIRNDNDLVFIDEKWKWLEAIPIDYALFRSLHYFLTQNHHYLRTNKEPSKIIISLIKDLYPQYCQNRHLRNTRREAEFSAIIKTNPVSEENSSPLLSVIIVTYNSKSDIEACIESIRRNTISPYEIIIIDNASSDGTVEFLAGLEYVRLLPNQTNNGFARACNQGIRKAKGEYIVLLNPDTMVTESWDVHMMGHFREGVGAVGPLSNYVAGIQKLTLHMHESLQGAVDLIHLGNRLYERNKGSSVDTKLLIGFCLMTKREIIKQVGLLDEDLFLGNDDLEYSLRLRNRGYRLIVAADTFVYHKGQSSFLSEPPERTDALVQESTDRLYGKLQLYYGEDQVPSSQELWDMDWFKPSPHLAREPKLVSLIILAHNALDYTKKCISSILEYTQEPFELIVIDNGSDDGTPDFLNKVREGFGISKDTRELFKPSQNAGRQKNEQPLSDTGSKCPCTSFKIIRNDQNLGFSVGNNQGIEAATGRYIVLMNNDVVVTKGWLSRLIACAERRPQAGIVGPMSNYVSGPQFVESVPYDITTLSGLTEFADKFSTIHAGKAKRFWRVVGFCMLIKRSVIEKIGGLDQRYGLGNFEDDDFNLRATIAGFESWIAEDCFIHHFGSRTFLASKIDYEKSLNRNWEIFKNKWGIPQDQPYGVSYDLSEIVKRGFNRSEHYCPFSEKETENPHYKKEPDPLTKDFHLTESLEPLNERLVASIIVLAFDSQKYIRECIDSIKKNTPETHEVIIVHSQSNSRVTGCLAGVAKESFNFRLVRVPKRRNFAQCCNAGIKASSGTYVTVLHSDVIATEGWLSGMLESMEAGPDIGIVGPMTNNVDGVQRVPSGPSLPGEHLEPYAKAFRTRNRYRQVRVGTLSSFCFTAKRHLIEKIGMLDEQFTVKDVALEDFCLRSAMEGLESAVAADVFVHHYNRSKSQMVKRETSWQVALERKSLSEKLNRYDVNSSMGKKLLLTIAIREADNSHQRGALEKAVNIISDAIKKVPHDNRVLYFLSRILIATKRYREALEVLDAAVRKDDMGLERLKLIGYCNEGMGDSEKAEDVADTVLFVNPSQPEALNLKGLIAFKRGFAAEAERFFRKATKSSPSYGEPFSNLGAIAWEAGNIKEALRCFEKAFLLDPSNSEITDNYHAAVVALSDQERAEELFRDGISLHPFNKKIAYLYIDILIQLGKYQEAMEALLDTMMNFGMEDDALSCALALRKNLGPVEIDRSARGKASVSLCMIVKNEEEHLARCLGSVKAIVDEMIIVDTGSEDKTKEIALAFGANVFDFEWAHDFSEARNFSLSKAVGDWVFILDADEQVSPLDHQEFRRTIRNEKLKRVAYSFNTRNYTQTTCVNWVPNDHLYPKEQAGIGWVPSWKVRLFKRDTDIRFKNSVHELLEPSLEAQRILIKKSDLPIHHYGKLNHKKIISKGNDYYILGQEKLKRNNDDLKALSELAIQAGELANYNEAIELWDKVLSIHPDNPGAYLSLGHALLMTGRCEKAYNSIQKALELHPSFREAIIERSKCEICMGDASRAVSSLQDLLVKEPDHPTALSVLSAACFSSGREKEGMRHLRKLLKLGDGQQGTFRVLAKLMIETGQIESASQLLEASIKASYFTKDMPAMLYDCYYRQNANRGVSMI
jgi:GT2 family glycosyltransferase/cytochrome c-type biogenesis protein CcmH/NrfG/SAM-dependent methyltransferase